MEIEKLLSKIKKQKSKVLAEKEAWNFVESRKKLIADLQARNPKK